MLILISLDSDLLCFSINIKRIFLNSLFFNKKE
jgi:hypothetical protein